MSQTTCDLRWHDADYFFWYIKFEYAHTRTTRYMRLYVSASRVTGEIRLSNTPFRVPEPSKLHRRVLIDTESLCACNDELINKYAVRRAGPGSAAWPVVDGLNQIGFLFDSLFSRHIFCLSLTGRRPVKFFFHIGSPLC